jgi:hypothetical protein
MHPWTLYALEVSRDRDRDVRLRYLLKDAQPDTGSHRSRLRRPVARIFAALSRASAAAARRLDDCVADDLGRSMTLSK